MEHKNLESIDTFGRKVERWMIPALLAMVAMVGVLRLYPWLVEKFTAKPPIEIVQQQDLAATTTNENAIVVTPDLEESPILTQPGFTTEEIRSDDLTVTLFEADLNDNDSENISNQTTTSEAKPSPLPQIEVDASRQIQSVIDQAPTTSTALKQLEGDETQRPQSTTGAAPELVDIEQPVSPTNDVMPNADQTQTDEKPQQQATENKNATDDSIASANSPADPKVLVVTNPESQAQPITPSAQTGVVVIEQTDENPQTQAPPVVVDTDQTELRLLRQHATEDIRTHIQNWQIAWADQDIESYLNAYIDDYRGSLKEFDTPKAWRAWRSKRVLAPESISIEVNQLAIEIYSNMQYAVAEFQQVYRSPTYQDTVKKRLDLAKVGTNWVISGEHTL